MRLPACVVKWLWRLVRHHADERVPDEIIGHNARWRSRRPDGEPVNRPFLLRWYLWPKNRFCNAYLHQFIRNDEDRALHDHPWCNLSILLAGQYIEHTILDGGVHSRQTYRAGALKFRSPWSAHRVELTETHCAYPDCTCDFQPGSCRAGLADRAPRLPAWVEYDTRKAPSWSLFVTGPKMQEWGFHCPAAGWRSSHKFHDKGGCND